MEYINFVIINSTLLFKLAFIFPKFTKIICSVLIQTRYYDIIF